MDDTTMGSPRRLEQFQDAFAKALLGVEPSGEGREAIARLVAQPGFAVYRNTVVKGCIDALQANYPSVARLVGEEWFRAAAAIYVRQALPKHPTLADYGEGFADFLAGFPPAAELQYLASVARLDRFWTEAHIAPDEAPIEPAAIARLDLEELARVVVRPHTSGRWVWFEEQPIVSIWRRNRRLKGDANADDDAPDLVWQGEGVLVVRPVGPVESIDLDRGGCVFLDACAGGQTLAEAAAASLAVDPVVDLAQLMARLLEAGAFGRLDLVDDEPKETTR